MMLGTALWVALCTSTTQPPTAIQTLQRLSESMQSLSQELAKEIGHFDSFSQLSAELFFHWKRLRKYQDLQGGIEAFLKESPAAQTELRIQKFAEELEIAYANLFNGDVLEGAEARILSLVNELHAQVHGAEDEFRKWQTLQQRIESMGLNLKRLERNLHSEDRRRVGAAWRDFKVEIDNLLLHDASTQFVRPEHRHAKSLREVLETRVGQHRPDLRWYFLSLAVSMAKPSPLISTDWQRFVEELEKLRRYMAEDLQVDFAKADYVWKGNTLIQNYRERLRDNREYTFELSELTEDQKHFSRVRLEWVVDSVAVDGEIRELSFLLDESRDLQLKDSLRISSQALSALLKKTGPLLSVGSFLRLKFYGCLTFEFCAEGGEALHLDFGFFRSAGKPLLGLRGLPRYFPLGGQQSDVHLATELGHHESHEVDRSWRVFWEDLRSKKVTYDQVRIVDSEHGEVILLPIHNDAAIFRHHRITHSFHMAPWAEYSEDFSKFKYQRDSPVPVQFKLRIQIR